MKAAQERPDQRAVLREILPRILREYYALIGLADFMAASEGERVIAGCEVAPEIWADITRGADQFTLWRGRQVGFSWQIDYDLSGLEVASSAAIAHLRSVLLTDDAANAADGVENICPIYSGPAVGTFEIGRRAVTILPDAFTTALRATGIDVAVWLILHVESPEPDGDLSASAGGAQ
jgi:hypothetical protein